MRLVSMCCCAARTKRAKFSLRGVAAVRVTWERLVSRLEVSAFAYVCGLCALLTATSIGTASSLATHDQGC